MTSGFVCDRSGSALGKARRTPSGGYRVAAVIARSGCMTYDHAGGRVVEYTPPAVLAAAAAGLRDAPVTNLHPPASASAEGPLVTTDNRALYAKGHVSGEATFDGRVLTAELAIDDAGLIDAIERGRREVSLGYLRDLDFTPGVDPVSGQRYDAVRLLIRPNHVAIVDVARAGREARLALDGAETKPHERPLKNTKTAAPPTPAVDEQAQPWKRPLKNSK